MNNLSAIEDMIESSRKQRQLTNEAYQLQKRERLNYARKKYQEYMQIIK